MKGPVDPVFVVPRLVPRTWGASDLRGWRASAPRPATPIGEIWLSHPANQIAEGGQLGAALSQAPATMLGDLGRAPPCLRLVLTGRSSSQIVSEGPLALWRIIDSGPEARLAVETSGKRPRRREMRCKPGDLFRASDHAQIAFGEGVVALEARANFAPGNAVTPPAFLPLLAPRRQNERATWLRDAAMSIEVWRLVGASRAVPDGETCHVLLALTEGARVDGRLLRKGEAVFLPAEGRPVGLEGAGAQVLVAYPDLVPTSIWRHAPAPDHPVAMAMQPPSQPAFATA